MNTLGSLFDSVCDCSGIAPALLNGEILDVNINNKIRLITINVHFDTYINFDELIKSEKKFSKALNSQVLIKPKFNSELFSADCFQSLYATVRREMPSINGTLNNAEVSYEDNVLTIKLQNGGKALLDAKEFDKALARIINEQFSLNVAIKYTGIFEVKADSEEYRQAIKSAEEQARREQIQLSADYYGEQHSIGSGDGDFVFSQLFDTACEALVPAGLAGAMEDA